MYVLSKVIYVLTTETVWPKNPKVFTLWPFTEVCVKEVGEHRNRLRGQRKSCLKEPALGPQWRPTWSSTWAFTVSNIFL